MVKPLERFGTFLAGVREEMKQVSWPSREDLIGAGVVVFVGVVLLATFISACDVILSKAAQFILR